MTPEGVLAAHIAKHKRVLIVLQTLAAEHIVALCAQISPRTHITALSVGVGVSSVLTKHTCETHDIATAISWDIYEPLDIAHFHAVLHVEGRVLVRIGYDDMPEQIFAGEKALMYQQPYISFIPFGYYGHAGTVITIPSFLPRVSQALQSLQTTHGRGYDLFVCTHYGQQFSDALIQSIAQTGKVIIVHDQDANTAWQEYVDKTYDILRTSETPGERYAFYKIPTYEKITTFLPEYMYEAAEMEGEHIVEYLLSLPA